MRRAERGHGCPCRGNDARTGGARSARAAFAPLVWSAATVVLLAGCSGSPQRSDTPQAQSQTDTSDWLWEGETADTPDNSLAAMLARQAADLDRMTADGPIVEPSPDLAAQQPVPRLQAPPTITLERPAAHRTNEPHTPTANDALLRALSLAGGGTGTLAEQIREARAQAASSGDPADLDTAEAAATDEDRALRIAELANELAALLKDESARLDDPTRALVPTALLGAIAGGVIDEADLPGGGRLMLTETERDALLAIRELAVRLVADDAPVAGDPQRVREILLSMAEQLREHARVRIAHAELCVRVPGFGSYIPIARRTFLAGQTNRVVVYAEVEHFGLRPATQAEATTPGDAVAAELTQEMELYLREGDPQPTWQRRVDWLPQTSRRAFRDMFVATAIELPATLSVGEYDLKIRIVDEVTGAQDETVIPIRLVADASALDDGPRDRAAEAQPTPRRSSGFVPSFTAREQGPPATR